MSDLQKEAAKAIMSPNITWYNEVPIKRLDPRATIPTKGSRGAAGFDLYAIIPEDVGVITLHRFARLAIPTGVSIACPEGTYARIAPRSGLAYKHGINVLAGVIDSDYRGEIKVILINHGDLEFDIRHGDRIAQMIFERHEPNAYLFEVADLNQTDRGENRFGSTGI